MSLSWVQIFILTIIPLGQLYARIFYLKGSLDSKWALFPLFMIPPLQFIPIMMMKLKLIKKGKGGQPYDYFMLIPIILKFVLTSKNFEKLNPINPAEPVINIFILLIN